MTNRCTEDVSSDASPYERRCPRPAEPGESKCVKHMEKPHQKVAEKPEDDVERYNVYDVEVRYDARLSVSGVEAKTKEQAVEKAKTEYEPSIWDEVHRRVKKTGEKKKEETEHEPELPDDFSTLDEFADPRGVVKK